MKLTNNVHSSDLNFKRVESNVVEGNIDTIYFRFNEVKWIDEDVHVGWIYSEYQFTLFEFISMINTKNDSLEIELVESNMELFGALSATIQQREVEQAEMLMEIMNLISQIQGGV